MSVMVEQLKEQLGQLNINRSAMRRIIIGMEVGDPCLSYDLETLGIFDRVARARVEDLEMIEQEGPDSQLPVELQPVQRGRLHLQRQHSPRMYRRGLRNRR